MRAEKPLRACSHTERDRRVRLAGWMLKISQAAHGLFQVLSVFKNPIPARREYNRAQNVRGAYRNLYLPTFRDSLAAVHCTAQTVTVLPVLSVPSSKVSSEGRGKNM